MFVVCDVVPDFSTEWRETLEVDCQNCRRFVDCEPFFSVDVFFASTNSGQAHPTYRKDRINVLVAFVFVGPFEVVRGDESSESFL